MKIAIIPARGGSKRIPRKNIRQFHGKPMLAWSIEAARASQLFERVIVSTDDPEIAEIARDWGAETPFVRPAELSDDYVGTTEVIAHAVQWAMDEGLSVEGACCIYATAPFIQIADLKLGWERLAQGNFMFAFSATEFPSPIFRSFLQLEEDWIRAETFATILLR
jgi:pseudaminic acid cytidylyltransferase